MYVLVRSDLPKTQPAVQAGHALAGYLLEHPNANDWGNGTLVYLGVSSEEELLTWAEKLSDVGVVYSIFREPYYDNEATALASLCFCDEKVLRKLLKDLPLL